MRRSKIRQAVLLLTLGLGGVATPAASALPVPGVSIHGMPQEVLIGEEFHFQVVVSPDPTGIGYGPFVELYVDLAGADCTREPSLPQRCDGLHFEQAVVQLASSTLPLTPCPAASALPFAFPVGPACAPPSPLQCLGTTSATPDCFFGAAPPTCGGESTAGYQKVVLLLPFGSFIPGQPPITVDVTARMDSYADEGTPLKVKARGGFRFADDPLGSKPASLDLSCPLTAAATTAKVLRLKKEYLGAEGETATGPSFPRQYKITVDIADGQMVDDLEVDDCLSGDLFFLSVSAPGATASFDAGSHCITVHYPPLTGGPGDADASFTFTFFVPENDTSGQQILGPSCKTPVPDHASASAQWIPQDPRDTPPVPVSAQADDLLTAKCLALQKSFQVVSELLGGGAGPTPGDIVEFRLDFQVSDFRTVSGIILEDLLSDGLTLLPGARLQVTDKDGILGGALTGVFTPGVNLLTSVFHDSAAADVYTCSDGTGMFQPTRLEFRISQLLASLAGGAGRYGQGIVTGGRAGLPLDGPATGVVVFRARITDAFQRQPGVELKVDKHDPLPDCAVARADVRPNTDEPALPGPPVGSADDDSMAPLAIVHGLLRKSVYAINGSTGFAVPPLITPGDLVTFRVELPVPSTDAEALTFDDFLPLPAFHVGSSFPLGLSCQLPTTFAANTAELVGPLCNYLNSAGPVPTLTPLPSSNSLHFDFGTIQDPANQQRKVDLLFTLQASADPFADGLHLTNHVGEREQSTFGAVFAESEAAEMVLGEPRLRIRKGVVASSRDNLRPTPLAAVYTPPLPSIPPFVAFNPPGTLPPFIGTLISSNVGLGMNSDVSNVDACDFVRFAIAVENLGTSPKGAFDVRLSDLLNDHLPPCLVHPFNFQVVNGHGVPFHCNGGQSCSSLLASFLTPAGITLDDAPGAGALAPFSPNGGDNLAIVTFDARVACVNAIPGCCTDTAKILHYAGTEGGPDHTQAGFAVPFPDLTKPFEDTARVCVTPRLTKSIVGTSEPHTPANPQQATLAIGEIVRFRLQVGVPEGKSPGMTLTDLLPANLVWLPGTCSLVTQSAAIVASPPIFTVNGASLTVAFGNVANTANSPGAEVLAVECDALVRNRINQTLVNFSGQVKPNSFALTVHPPSGAVTFTSNTVQAVIAEPAGGILKQEVFPAPTLSTAVYLLTYKNTGSTTAFDLHFLDPLPAPLALSGPVAASAPCSILPALPNVVSVSCPSLPPGGTVTVQFHVSKVPFCLPVKNQASLTYTSLPGVGTPKGKPGNLTGASTPGASGTDFGERVYTSISAVTTSRCPDLTIHKAHAGSFSAGQNGTYTVTVANPGTAPSVPPDTVTDTLPPGITFVSGGGDGWVCTAAGPKVTCVRNTPIPPGGSTLFTITVAVRCGQRDFENCALVSTVHDASLDNNRSCDPTAVVIPAARGCFVAVAAGGNEQAHSLALRSDGTVWAWGDDEDLELGDGGGHLFSSLPVQVRGPDGDGFLTGVMAIAAGRGGSLGVKGDGTLWTWGAGAGSIGPDPLFFPRQVPGLSEIVAAAAGEAFALALQSNGTVWAWGDGGAGELGNGTIDVTDQPVPVNNLSGVTAIAAGDEFAVAVKSDGTVWTWGNNDRNQLGQATASQMALLPVQVPGLTGVATVAAGHYHALALKKDGSVWAWGSGPLGNGVVTPASPGSPPVQILGTASPAAAVAAESDNSYAVLKDGTVRAWGSASFGALGNGSGVDSLAPTAVSLLTGAKGIAAAAPGHALVVEGDGTIWAWGHNVEGQVGDGSFLEIVPLPVKVALPCPGCTAPPSGMTAWWTFDEPGGPVAQDRAGVVMNDGAWTPAAGPQAGPGRVSGGLCFDGVSAHVEVPNSPELQLGTGDFTIDAWVRTSFRQGVVTLVDKRQTATGNSRGYALYLVNGRLGFQMADRAGTTTCSALPTDGCTNFAAPAGTSVADGLWHHIAVTVRRIASGGVFYDNGTVVGTFDPTARPMSLDSTAALWIAAERPVLGSSIFFQGCLDELEIFKRALGPEEVAAIYGAGGAGKCKCAAPQACVPVENGHLTCLGTTPSGASLLGFSANADLLGPFSLALESATSPHGAVQSFGTNGHNISGAVVDTSPPDNPFCLVFGLEAQGGFHCETLVCQPRPVCQ